MKYLAILKDSFLETIDFKVFYILVALSVLLGLVCATFTFHRLPAEEALARNIIDELKLDRVEQVSRGYFSPCDRYRFELKPMEGDDFFNRLQQAINRNERDRRARIFQMRMQMGLENRRRGEPAQLPDHWKPVVLDRPADSSGWAEVVRHYLLSIPGIREVEVRPGPSEREGLPSTFQAEADINWGNIRGAHDLGLLFGVWKVPLGETPVGEVVGSYFQGTLLDLFAGWVGIIIAIVVTAGFIPNMMRKGTVDLLLVKPISRPALLVYKYLGGLTFVFLNALVLIACTWIAFGITTGNWSPWLLASVLVLTFCFAILYSLSVLIGVVTRSPLAAILITMAFWFLLWLINQAYVISTEIPIIQSFIANNNAHWAQSTIDWLHFLLPKPSDMALLNEALVLQVNGSEDLLEVQRGILSKFSWTETLATSSAFIVVMLGIACWRFSRRDY